MEWLIYCLLAMLLVVMVTSFKFKRMRTEHDAWVLKHGDFMLFDKGELADCWRLRNDVRNKTTVHHHVFYKVTFQANDHELEFYFRAPIAFEKLSTSQKTQMFKVHYWTIFDTIPSAVTMMFNSYM